MRRGWFCVCLFISVIFGLLLQPGTVGAKTFPGFISGDGDWIGGTPVPEPTTPGGTPAQTSKPDSTKEPGSTPGNNGDTFTVSDGNLTYYRGTSEEVTIPASVRTISSAAFSHNQTVRAVVIPATVKKVETGAFYNCPYLRYILFEGNPTVKSYAVYRCIRFTNISAGKNTKPYQYAVKEKIPVVTTKKPKLAVKKLVFLAGDKKKNTLYNTYQTVTWKTSKKSVLTVSGGGEMKAVRAGKVKVTAYVNNTSYTCQVTVKKRTNKNRVVLVSKDIIKKKMSRYKKIKTVHDWMIANVKYDYDGYLSGLVPPVSHSATGALMKGLAVCDGYAHAFKLFMNHLKIPCRFVVGRSGAVGHGWNMVKLGGKWYHIDVTFDDPIIGDSNENTKPYYTYFLKSSSVMRKSHKWKISKYPRCKSKKYDKI